MTLYYKHRGLTQEFNFLLGLRRFYLEILKTDNIVVLNEDMHCFRILYFTQTALHKQPVLFFLPFNLLISGECT